MESSHSQTLQPSFNDNTRFDLNNSLFSDPQTLDGAGQNDSSRSTISGQTAWLSAPSNDCSTINHRQCPTCLRPFSVGGSLEGKRQYEINNLLDLGPLFPKKSLPTPGAVQDGHEMASTNGDNASPKHLETRQQPIIQPLQAQSSVQHEQDMKALQSATTPTRNRSKPKSTPKQHRRKPSNVKCEICDGVFTRVYDLQRHLLHLHTGQVLRWTCTYCDGRKSFCREDKLNKHLRDRHPEFNIKFLIA